MVPRQLTFGTETIVFFLPYSWYKAKKSEALNAQQAQMSKCAIPRDLKA